MIRPSNLTALSSALTCYLNAIGPGIGLADVVLISLRELHLVTEEVDLNIRDGRDVGTIQGRLPILSSLSLLAPRDLHL